MHMLAQVSADGRFDKHWYHEPAHITNVRKTSLRDKCCDKSDAKLCDIIIICFRL